MILNVYYDPLNKASCRLAKSIIRVILALKVGKKCIPLHLDYKAEYIAELNNNRDRFIGQMEL